MNENLFSNSFASQRLSWKSFNQFDMNGSEPKNGDGASYICLDIHGNYSVCIWDGKCREWLIDVGNFCHSNIVEQMKNDVCFHLCEEFAKKAGEKFTSSMFNELIDRVDELAYEGRIDSNPVYFDDVEWYMQLPKAPNIDYFKSSGEDVLSDVFDQSVDLMTTIESAVKQYIASKIVKENDKHDPT